MSEKWTEESATRELDLCVGQKADETHRTTISRFPSRPPVAPVFAACGSVSCWVTRNAVRHVSNETITVQWGGTYLVPSFVHEWQRDALQMAAHCVMTNLPSAHCTS